MPVCARYENPLHAELLPILRALLATQPPTSGVALDLACGSGENLPLLRAACGPAAQLLALDLDAQAVRRVDAADALRLAGDALALPLRNASCDAVYCIAAYGLFADQALALRELRRVLKPGGHVLIVTATQLWAQVTRWPAALLPAISAAYAHAPPLAAHADLADSIVPALQAAFGTCAARAFLLEADTPLAAELALLDWARLRPHVAAHSTPADLTRFDAAAAEPAIELCSVVLAAWAA